MPKHTTLKAVAWIALVFIALVAAILYLAIKQVISAEMALLLFIALLGLYFGFGVLIAVYRFTGRLNSEQQD